MNKVHLVGRVTKDIELRQTQNGKSIASFYIAVNRKSKDDGADFIPCVAWEKTAELIEKYIRKGDRIGISGRINTRTYEDKYQKKIYVTEVVVEEIYFFEAKKKEETPQEADDDFPF